jgi:hypothetical protein
MPVYDRKVAVVVRADLLDWQKLNVSAFLASAVAVQFSETHGGPFVTADEVTYLPFIKHPVLVYQADGIEPIRRALGRARDRGLAIGIYTRPLFETKGEEGNLAAIAELADAEQDLVGLVVYGENNKVDKALQGLKFHP